MKTVTKFNFKTLTVLILSLVLCCSLALTAACGSGSTGSSSSSSSSADETVYPTDYQSVTNGDFEFSTFKTEDTSFPVSSSIGWTLSRPSYLSNSAPTSKYSSGIVNTEKTAYEKIAEKAGFAKDGDEYYNPGTPYDDGLVDYDYVVRPDGDEEFVNDDKLPMKGSKILMIHNETDDGEGTAQKFTSSSSLSLTKGTYGKISLWVKTYGLSSAYDRDDFGAYVAIENTVSSSLSPVIVKGINTDGNWVKYSFYLAANDLTDSSFKIILGLGFGNSGKLKNEFVQGFAYFDDVTFTEISASDYENAETIDELCLFDGGESVDEDNLIVTAKNGAVKNENKAFSHEVYAISHLGGDYSSVDFGGNVTSGAADKNGADVSVSEAINAVNDSAFVSDDDKIVAPVAISDGKAVYAIKNDAKDNTKGDFEYTTSAFTVGSGEYFAYTFFVKSYLERTTRTGLTITVNDLGKEGTSEYDHATTSLVSNLCTNDYENESYNNWRKYTVLISNTVDVAAGDTDRNFSLTFSFGNDDGDNWDKAKGYVIIAGFECKQLSETEYNFANTTDAVKVALTADLPNGVESDSSSSDTYGFTYATVDTSIVKNGGVASNVLNYTGVVGNSHAVGGPEDNKYSADGVLAGVINTKGLVEGGDAGLSDEQIAEINNLGKADGNDYLQPLMINNTKAASYGFYGSSATLSANSVTLYTITVKPLGNAKAFVYLADANALDGFNVLSVYGEAHDDVKQVNEEFAVEVTNGYQTKTQDGWYVIYFVVETGDDSKNVRVELWNGSRDGETKSEGVVLFGAVSKTTVTLDGFKADIKATYGDTDENAKLTKYTRMPTTHLVDDEDGELTNALTDKKYSKETICYNEETVFAVYENSKAVIGSYANIDVTHEIDDRTSGDVVDDDSSSDEDEEEDEAGFSWALQITSIIIAAVLIVLLVVVFIRMLVKKSGKNKAVVKTYYDRDSRDRTNAQILKNKKAAKKVEAPAEDEVSEEPAEVKPYDYDNMENNIEPDGSNDEPIDADVNADNAEVSAEAPEENEVSEEPATPVEENATPAEEVKPENNDGDAQ